MKTAVKIPGLVKALALWACLFTSLWACDTTNPQESPAPSSTLSPSASATATPTPTPTPSLPPTPTPSAGAQIIADHTVVERYADIPQDYIDAVKLMWINVPGESHSQAYRTGLGLLEELDARFATEATTEIYYDSSPTSSTANGLRVSRNVWNGEGAYAGTGEADWYTNAVGIARMKAHLDYFNGPTGNIPIAAMGFGWCWDMTWINEPGGDLDPEHLVHWAGSSVGGPQDNLRWGLDAADEALTGNSVCMQTYLDATQAYIDYCTTKGYDTVVFYTTGPVDGYDGENGVQRQLKHDFIRDWVAADASRVLFDYADILAWNDEREEYTQTWTDSGANERSYQMIHPDNNIHDPEIGHIGPAGAVRLAKAMWWMLARIAGWDGVSQ